MKKFKKKKGNHPMVDKMNKIFILQKIKINKRRQEVEEISF